MEWQDWLREEAGKLGVTVTSGYRSPEHNKEIGGAPNSNHTKGTAALPGAMDIGGAASALKTLFDMIRKHFSGRIKELYLNLPNGHSEAIRNNTAISGNPEAGRPQHLHVALPAAGGSPASGIPLENRGDKALAASSDCSRRFCLPNLAGMAFDLNPLKGNAVRPEAHCVCWSDVWFYSGGTVLAVLGVVLLFASTREN